MNTINARVIGLHWEDRRTAVQEATLEVEHPNGERQFFVIPILRMSDRIASDAGRFDATDRMEA